MTFMPDDFYQAVNRERTSCIVQYGRLKEFKASYQASGYHNKKKKTEREATFNSNQFNPI